MGNEAFADKRLQLVIDDAKAWLERSESKFDVIIMDLDDPLEGGPCYQLYTTEFFSPINRTLKDVFPTVVPYNQAVYSFLDEWGWNLALTQEGAEQPTSLSADEVVKRIAARIDGELQFLDGISWHGIWALSKKHRKTLAEETVVMSVKGNTHRFMWNAGVATIAKAGEKPYSPPPRA